jgi:hypothetical protein
MLHSIRYGTAAILSPTSTLLHQFFLHATEARDWARNNHKWIVNFGTPRQ